MSHHGMSMVVRTRAQFEDPCSPVCREIRKAKIVTSDTFVLSLLMWKLLQIRSQNPHHSSPCSTRFPNVEHAREVR